MQTSKAYVLLGMMLGISISSSALAQANHNSVRSNKATVAAPNGETAAPDQPSSDAAAVAKANINTSRSNSKGLVPPAPDTVAEVTAVAPVPVATADASPANINTSRSNTKQAKTPQ